MDIGVVLQTTPPSARVVDLAKRAETYGFSHVWTFDSHILWEEPFPIYTRILAETRNVTVGPMVTNPRDPRLDRHREPVRDAERDVRQPHGDRHRPRRLGGPRHQRQAVDARDARASAVHVIRELANGREVELTRLDDPLPVGGAEPGRGVGRRLRAEGAAAEPARSATASSCSSPTPTSRRGRSAPCGQAADSRRARPRRRHDLRRGAGLRRR